MAERSTLRVSDAEREQVAARLVRAHGEGRLGLAEFDERVRAAHGAVVVADLVPLTADLPADTVVGSRPAAPTRPRTGALPFPSGLPVPPSPPGMPFGPGAGSLRAAAAVWALVSAVNVVIWVAVVVGTGHPVHPWWIWVAGPWGVALALRAVAGRAAGAVSAEPSGWPRPAGSSRR